MFGVITRSIHDELIPPYMHHHLQHNAHVLSSLLRNDDGHYRRYCSPTYFYHLGSLEDHFGFHYGCLHSELVLHPLLFALLHFFSFWLRLFYVCFHQKMRCLLRPQVHLGLHLGAKYIHVIQQVYNGQTFVGNTPLSYLDTGK